MLDLHAHFTRTSVQYIPVADVGDVLQKLKNEAPGTTTSWNTTLVAFPKEAGGRRCSRANQHAASALTGNNKTNNISKEWYNRFCILVGKHHQDVYAALTEIQEEQGATEVTLAELSLGKEVVRNTPEKKWLELQARIRIPNYYIRILTRNIRTMTPKLIFGKQSSLPVIIKIVEIFGSSVFKNKAFGKISFRESVQEPVLIEINISIRLTDFSTF